ECLFYTNKTWKESIVVRRILLVKLWRRVMLNRSVKQALWAVFFFGFTLSSAQTNPFDSWRALIVFTNTMPYVWGTTNPYRDFFITVFDGMNQSYEASGLSTRTQI